MLRWLGTLPDGLVFVLFGTVGIAVTFAFDWIMRRCVKPETRQRASSTASVTLQVTATIYAILIAFVIVDAYSQVSDAQSDLSSKAASMAVIYENSRALPEPGGSAVRAATLAYAHSVVDRAIPRIRETDDPDRETDKRLEQLFVTVQHLDPASESARSAYEASLRGLDNVVATRAKLIDAARPTIPDELIFLLITIGLVVMAVATLLDTQHHGSHLFILSALALVIWMTLALVISLNYPFAGLIRVTDTPIREFLHFRAAR